MLLALLVMGAGSARAQLLPFVHYTPDREVRALPSAEAHSVHQDRLGFLWIVVYSSGLVRYDGARMELYTEDDGLPGVALWDVTEDAQGHLWATSNAGLAVSEEPLQAYTNGRRIRFVTHRGETPLLAQRVRRNVMGVDGEGVVWVGTDGLGIVRYHPLRGRVEADTLRTAPETGDEAEAVRSLVARQDGTVWAGLVHGPLLRYAGGVGRLVTGPGAPTQSVFALYESPQGELWGGDRRGRLWRLLEGEGGYRFETVSEALSAPILDIQAAADGRLFVASEGGGLLVIDPRDPSRQRVYTRQHGLLSDVVHALTEDAEGSLWVAQSGGISKLRANHRAFAAYTARSMVGERPLLPAPAVNAVEPTPRRGPCAAWVGSSGGGAACLHAGEGGGSTYVQASDGLSSDYVNALVLDREGRLWVGTSAGIDAIAPAGVALPPPPRPARALRVAGAPHRLASYTPTSILAIADAPIARSGGGGAEVGAIWFAGYQALFGHVEGGGWFRLAEAAGLPATVLHAVARDGGGHLWVGTRDRGLYRSTQPLTLALLQRHGVPGGGGLGREVSTPLFEQVWSSATGAPTDQVEALLWNEGAMWAATPSGMFAFRGAPGIAPPGTVTQLDKRGGLGAAHVFSLARSPATGTVWAGTNAGLAEIDPRAGTVLRQVTRGDGLVDNEVWYYGSVRTDAEGRVFFGTATGLSVYTPSLDRRPSLTPALHLRRAEYRGARDGHNEALFEYAATSFAREGAVRYRTRLAGYEPDWSEPTAEAKIRYTNLPALISPRTYTFMVIASADGEAWTPEPATYSFRVHPPWWLQAWAFLLYVLVLGVAGAMITQSQRRRIVRRERERARLREAEHRAEQAATEHAVAEARARALQAENERKEAELQKAHELEEAYAHLQATQAQLIQAEKMASLGQLTAGIAHEIKNPLNFVNNFSRASVELVGELREELGEAPPPAVAAILDDIATMSSKVAEHGDRADRIVRSMLQHSRGSSGTFHEVDVNVFVEEYVNLAFHGMRAQVAEFNVDIVRDYAEDAGHADVVPQELGRVLINLLNNAFYAVHEQRAHRNGQFAPRVTIRTRREGRTVLLNVEDNGGGIPPHILDHIFEPFFTTKPAGAGTGLGLSLSYDIITQMHRGQLRVETEEGEGTAFVLTLPARHAAPPAPAPKDAAPAALPTLP